MTNPFHQPLTTDNAVLLLVDHQIGLFTGVRDMGVDELKHNVVALARAALRLDIPVVVTTTSADGMWGPLIPELQDVLPKDLEVFDRSTVNAWHDDRVRGAVEAAGRDRIIVAGTSLRSAPPCRRSRRPPPATPPMSPWTPRAPSRRSSGRRACSASSRPV